jgi:mannose-6-phosphate isomerase-like protein (cupin superfamily)
MGASFSYSVSKSRSYEIQFPSEYIDDDPTPLKDIPGFSEFENHVYFINPKTFGVIKVHLTTTLGSFYKINQSDLGLIIIGDVNDSSNLLLTILVSVVLFGIAVYLYAKQPLLSLLCFSSILVLNIFFSTPKTSPDETTTLAEVLSSLTEQQSSFLELSRIAIKVSNNTFVPSQLRLRMESSNVPGIVNSVANDSLEFAEVSPNTVTPLHTHTSKVYALALTDNLEYMVERRQWKVWKKGQILTIPPMIKHAIRNIGQEPASLLSSQEGHLSALSDFHSA